MLMLAERFLEKAYKVGGKKQRSKGPKGPKKSPPRSQKHKKGV